MQTQMILWKAAMTAPVHKRRRAPLRRRSWLSLLMD